jgi:hypothetical protein
MRKFEWVLSLTLTVNPPSLGVWHHMWMHLNNVTDQLPVSWINTKLKSHFLDGSSPHTHIVVKGFGNMLSGMQDYWSIYIYINKYCWRVNTLKIWTQIGHKQNKNILSVYAVIWTRISRMNDGHIRQLCRYGSTFLI